MSTTPRSTGSRSKFASAHTATAFGGVSTSNSSASHANPVSERRPSSVGTDSQLFSNNPYGQAPVVIDDAPRPSTLPRPQVTSAAAMGSVGSLNDVNPDDSAEITSLFTTFDPSSVCSQQRRASGGSHSASGLLGGSAMHPGGQRAGLNRSQPLSTSVTHSPYAPVTEEGLRARQLQQQQLQSHQQSMHHSQELHYGAYGAAPTPLNASNFDYGGGVSGHSRFNGSTSQADLNPLAFNFDHVEGAARTPLSAGNSTSDVVTLVDVYENDTITVSVKQRAGPSQRAGSRSNSLNGSSVAIQQMIEAAEKGSLPHTHMKSPASSFHAGSHQHYVPNATILQQGSSLPTLQPPPSGILYQEGPYLYAPGQAPPSQQPPPHGAGPFIRPYMQASPPPGFGAPYGGVPMPAAHVDRCAAETAATHPHHYDHRHQNQRQHALHGVAPHKFADALSIAPDMTNSIVPPHNAPRGRGAKAGRGGHRGGGEKATMNALTGSGAGTAPTAQSGGGARHAHSASVNKPAAAESKETAEAEDATAATSSGNARRTDVTPPAIAEHADRSLPVRGFVVVKGKHDSHRYATTLTADQLPALGSHVIVEGDRGEDMGILTHLVTVPEMISNCLALHKLRQAEARRRMARDAERDARGDGKDAVKRSTNNSDDDGEDEKAKGKAVPMIDVEHITVAEDDAGQQAQIKSIVFTYKDWPYYLREATSAEIDRLPSLRAEESAAFDVAEPVVTHFVTIAFQQQLQRQTRHVKEAGDATEVAGQDAPGSTEDVHRPAPANPAEVKLVDCEYQLDHKKLTLFVVRPSREVFVDFRRMQRKLFRAFHCRIWFVYMDEVSEDSDASAAVAFQLQRPSAGMTKSGAVTEGETRKTKNPSGTTQE